ncbi:Multi antimicrobial extrusion protein [Sesbania bispinosa]|nr:Multi antimicrobial extrusion protein [Sesbania bispinosa]
MRNYQRQQQVVEEVKRQLWLAVPLCSVGILQYSLQTISVMFVGHLGTLPLSGASMATSFASVTGFNLLMGLASALDTFCGQSFGAGQYHILGIHMQRSMLVVIMISVFLAIIWANTEPILVAMQQDKAISKEAGPYACFLIPGLFAYGLLQCILKFLQTQSIVFPMFSSSCKQSWTGFSKSAIYNVLDFLKLAVPSALMLCLKVWTFELMVLMSGLLPDPALETSVLSICLNTFGLAWMIPFGFSAAVSTRVSNELGAGNPQAASLAVRVVLSIAIIEGVLLVSTMILLRNVWGHVYSNDKDVIRYVSSMMPILAVSSFLDGIQSALSGCGWQKIGAYVNLGSFYLVGVPCAVVLAFPLHMEAMGLWLGIISAFIVQVLFYTVITMRTNWEEEARKAQRRVESSTISQTTTLREDMLPPYQKLEQNP